MERGCSHLPVSVLLLSVVCPYSHWLPVLLPRAVQEERRLRLPQYQSAESSQQGVVAKPAVPPTSAPTSISAPPTVNGALRPPVPMPPGMAPGIPPGVPPVPYRHAGAPPMPYPPQAGVAPPMMPRPF
ncbi:hypothetical protein V5799_000775 [Amblyomma americanum]|uniref:Uncharacterized protein n=1 Tax=Amblyomma americanum TaxID=6943 RepID=A0AAQ4D235_AMBAM